MTARLRCTTVFTCVESDSSFSRGGEYRIPTSELSDHTRSLLRNAITAKDLVVHQIVSRWRRLRRIGREKWAATLRPLPRLLSAVRSSEAPGEAQKNWGTGL